MGAHALSVVEISDTDLFLKIQSQLIERYNVDSKLASEMAWDLVDMLSAIDGDIDIFEKYFLH